MINIYHILEIMSEIKYSKNLSITTTTISWSIYPMSEYQSL